MSNLWFNIRFGSYHWQLSNRWKFNILHNDVHDKRGPDFKWFTVYCAFGKHFFD